MHLAEKYRDPAGWGGAKVCCVALRQQAGLHYCPALLIALKAGERSGTAVTIAGPQSGIDIGSGNR